MIGSLQDHDNYRPIYVQSSFSKFSLYFLGDTEPRVVGMFLFVIYYAILRLKSFFNEITYFNIIFFKVANLTFKIFPASMGQWPEWRTNWQNKRANSYRFANCNDKRYRGRLALEPVAIRTTQARNRRSNRLSQELPFFVLPCASRFLYEGISSLVFQTQTSQEF